MILPLLLLAQAAGPTLTDAQRWEACVDLAVTQPAAAETQAGRWRVDGGGYLAQQCLGMAYATEGKWAAAAGAFEEAARTAEAAKDNRFANYWAQAGNAWLAGGDPVKAKAALDAALVRGKLTGLELGEAHLDRARALVALGDNASARADLDAALGTAAADPLAWLLSATLARRTGDLPRARSDIGEALKRSPDDAFVQLEAGNIAALSGDEAGARAAWNRVIEIAPTGEAANAAREALKQFGPGG